MASQLGVALPLTVAEFISKMKEGMFAQVTGTALNSFLGFVTLGAVGRSVESFGFNDIPAHKQQLVKYSGSALLHGRPLNALVIVLAGQSGRGKSTTIQRFFDDTIYNSETERTMKISVYEKQLTATTEDPSIIGRIKFIDFPGSLDEDPERGVENFARLINFRRQHPELADRSRAADNPDLKKYDIKPRKDVYPNLVLLVGSAADRLITQPNSDFRKSAAYLRASAIVDTERVNLVVVITHAMDIDYTHFQMRCETIKSNVRLVVQETFGIPHVRVVFIENKFEQRVGKMDGDFFILPNGERNYGNLKDTMQNMFESADDYIAMQFTSYYFDPRCPEKRIRPAHTCTDTQSYDYAPTGPQREEARNILAQLNMYTGNDPTQSPFRFNYLGSGYCPKSELSKNVGMFSNCLYHVSRGFGLPLRIPTNVSLSRVSKLEIERLSFESKDKYEEHRKRKLGFSTDLHLKVTGNVSASWGGSSESDQTKEILKFSFSFCYGTIEVNDIEDYLGDKLKNALNALPTAFDKNDQLTKSKFDLFFDRYGTHVISHIKVGGSIQIEVHLDKAKLDKTKKSTFELDLQSKLKNNFVRSMGGNVSLENSDLRDMISQTSFSNVKFEGGTPPLNVATLSDLTSELLSEWVASVRDMNPITELVDTIQVSPYFLMALSDEQKKALKDATADYLSRIPSSAPKNDAATRVQMAQRHAANARNQATAAASDSSCCFSDTTMVNVVRQSVTQSVPIHALQFGDLLCSSSTGLTSKFLTYLHYQPDKTAFFQAIWLEDGTLLELTGAHVLFQIDLHEWISGTKKPVPIIASNVGVGTFLLAGSRSSINGLTPTRVTSVQWITRTGVYCPYVDGGTFLANNIFVSSYSDLNFLPLALAEASLLPLNYYLQLTNSLRTKFGYQNASVFKDGIHPYAKVLMKIMTVLNSTNARGKRAEDQF